MPATITSSQIFENFGFPLPYTFLTVNNEPIGGAGVQLSNGWIVNSTIVNDGLDIEIDNSSNSNSINIPGFSIGSIVDSISISFEDSNNEVHNIPIKLNGNFIVDPSIINAPTFMAGSVEVRLSGSNNFGNYPVGGAGDGDIWVEGPLTIESYSPAPVNINGRFLNGAWLNPTSISGGINSSGQPFENLEAGNINQSPVFDPSLRAQFPITMVPNDVLVIGVSRLDAVSGSNVQSNGAIEEYVVITCVDAPPNVDEIRPPYIHPENPAISPRPTISVTLSDMANLPSISITEPLPNVNDILEDLQSGTLFDFVITWNDYNVEAKTPGTTYGRDMMRRLNDALTFLASDAPATDKLPIAREIVQRGWDMYNTFLNAKASGISRIWEANGYHNSGRKALIVIAGHIIGNNDMINIVNQTTLNSQQSFQDDGQYVFLSQAHIDQSAGLTLNGTSSEYPQDSTMVGVPEWVSENGDNHSSGQGHHRWRGQSFYRPSNISSMYGAVFYLLAAGLESNWNRDSFFKYARRHFDIEHTGIDPYAIQNGYTQFADAPSASSPNTFTEHALDEHFATFCPYPWESNMFHMALIGQSEPFLSIADTRTISTSGPYPTVLPGVDVQAVVPPDAVVGATTPQVVVVNQANADAGNVNPGLVALANTWHLGSGGQPLRLSLLLKSGTGMDSMMDDDLTSRNFADDKAIYDMANSLWGPAQRVTKNWHVSESSASQDLWGERSAHYFGINTDGTDYDFINGDLDHCLIDTTNRGFGILPNDCKVDVMYPGAFVPSDSRVLLSPRNSNYAWINPNNGTAFNNSTGARVIDNGPVAYQSHRDFVNINAPLNNRGVATVSPGLVKMGDYVAGVQQSGGQVSSHASVFSKYGQIQWGSEVGFSFLSSFGFGDPTVFNRIEVGPNSSYVDFIFDLPPNAELSTARISDGLVVSTPRPHQQEVMGFIIQRSGDNVAQGQPIFRTDNTDPVEYPVEYRGTVVIQDTGSDVGGGNREGSVRITPDVSFNTGDTILFGNDGSYGQFILHGYPDYDAELFLDGLRAYESRLDDNSNTSYSGSPVVNQISVTI